jgi:hypothetical protein
MFRKITPNHPYEGDACSTQISVDRNQVHPSKLAVWFEIEDLKRDIAELNQMLKTAKRQTVIEVILSEVNILSAKVASLCEVIEMYTVKDCKWSEVAAGKHKKFCYSRQINTYQIPVINNPSVTWK